MVSCLQNGLGAHRLRRADVALHHGTQDLFLAVRQALEIIGDDGVGLVVLAVLEEGDGVVVDEFRRALAAVVAGLQLVGGEVGVDSPPHPLDEGGRVQGSGEAVGQRAVGVKERQGGVGPHAVFAGEGGAVALFRVAFQRDEAGVEEVAHLLLREDFVAQRFARAAPCGVEVDEDHFLFFGGGL